jgi:hypothetical protein
MRPLHDVIAAAADLDCGVFWIGILLDLVAAMTDDCRLALLDDLGDFASGAAARPLPRDCKCVPELARLYDDRALGRYVPSSQAHELARHKTVERQLMRTSGTIPEALMAH